MTGLLGIEGDALCPAHRKSPQHRNTAAPHNAKNTKPAKTDNNRLQPAGNRRHNGQENRPATQNGWQPRKADRHKTQNPLRPLESDDAKPKPDKPKVKAKNQTGNRTAKAKPKLSPKPQPNKPEKPTEMTEPPMPDKTPATAPASPSHNPNNTQNRGRKRQCQQPAEFKDDAQPNPQ
ncbi:hypothetical protein [Methylovulum sp.]|uniref:hypothetical protein n=1 Tax=Methylovulum sp. TaxID=1916980 RepID=UPI00262F3FAF|nr:hypothetical protein [Methylovulum sp.]MDD2802095.1 hypothetical protein [Methylococcales bacterium]MDD5126415.1 hypothetical protein [Methylovulum sp.]